ncbi:uncharacterized protein METZ01_LOCUS107496, partial [marine metagenome]
AAPGFPGYDDDHCLVPQYAPQGQVPGPLFWFSRISEKQQSICSLSIL